MPYADPFVCPGCSSRLPTNVPSCAACGLLLRGPLASQLLLTLRTADQLLAQLQAASQPQVAMARQSSGAYPAPRVSKPPARSGVSALSVPKILLGLGALCLLVAAVIFLAVAWGWLGVGGRTAVLAGLTLLSGGLGVWLSRRDLRMAAEALTTVGLGLLVLDVVGADNAGWLGDLTVDGLIVAVGGALLTAALALALTTRLVAPQLISAVALSVLGAGLLVVTDHQTVVLVSVILGYVGLAVLGGVRRLPALSIAAAVGAGWWWLGLLVTGYQEATDHPSLHGLWAEGHGVSLLLASLMLLLPVPFARAHTTVIQALASVAVTMLTVTAGLPAFDEGATVGCAVALVALIGWALVSLVTPEPWRPVPWLPMLVTSLPVVWVTVALGAQAVANAVGSSDPFTGSLTTRLADPDPVAAPVLLLLGAAALVGAALAVLVRVRPIPLQVTAGVLVLAAVGTFALHPVPAWSVAGALTLLGAAFVADALRDEGSFGFGESLAGVATALLGLMVALPSDVLTAAVLAVLVAMTGALAWRGSVEQRVWGGLLAPAALAGFAWVACEVAGIEETQRGLLVLLLVGLLAIARPRPEIELSAATAGALASAVSIGLADNVSVALAVHLTVAGVLVSTSALIHRSRRDLGWAGGALLAAATWVRLADLGVTAPEAYTLPSAIALLVVGLVQIRRDPAASTMRALGPGLVLATVPSLLWVLNDPVTLRAVLLGAGCLALVLAGASLRWNAPLLVGAVVGTTVVLRELAPYAVEIPQWVLIGLAGTLLTVVGVTWERRLRDLQAAGAYVGRLR